MGRLTDNLGLLARTGLGTPLLLIALLVMIVLPLPPMALDVFFTFNIALALVVILMTVYAPRPLEFSVFPTVLLVATLLRLALNVASTRVVLMNGQTGTDAAGKVIEAFGEFVVGGNYAVGLVVFAILVIINFVVVTKGAGRVSEVSARFTLDALPGKQMAIDADLNSGLITQDEARLRRAETAAEADFYGSMDGASKFVRGDAVAGILILFINIIGGLIIGTTTHGMPLADAARTYILLTIGDGLVAQIPSLLLSSATAIIVTRVSAAGDMGSDVVRQLFGSARAIAIAAVIIGMLGLVPGMPNLVFLGLAAALGAGAWALHRRSRQAAVEVLPEEPVEPAGPRELAWDDVSQVDPVGMEVGYRLIPLVDRGQGGVLLERMKGVRRKLSEELGFLIPPVHVRDNLDLGPNAYRITLNGVPAARGEIHPDRHLAINPGRVYGTLEGTETTDPAFGLPAVWIAAEQRDQAQTLGYTVVDPATVVATHLSQVLREHAHELIGHDDAQQLLDRLAKSHPKLVENLVPKVLSLGVVLRVMQNLLAEQIPIRDMRTIAETLAENGARSQDPVALTAAVRAALARFIVQGITDSQEDLPLIALDPGLEQVLQRSLQATGSAGLGIEPRLAERLQRGASEAAQRQEIAGEPAVLVTSAELRPWLARWLRPVVRGLHVLAYTEIPDSRPVKVVATLGAAEGQAATAA
ncbi:flagellar biosynthesis protein FlhA [Thioalkalivibrio sp. XN8]|uniref:flagellar biosynthesis protein FlhA n=1 Tax=Thioalkalivibrio sp. XN8 TaxID=2712863 RepID=UPI0013EB4FE2|nr:flagellar biosynthesis protein FlhA [Thioalkalivibrio sp. XN8]NGP52518.1 flagellar biosynthesis protein FlhA [Thioalkalivibrio sp. XN8]